MHRPLLPVADITPTTRTWTARILVVQKLCSRAPRTGTKRYQRFILIDRDETKIQAITYSPDLDLMERILQIQETYMISNAKVVFVEPKFRLVPHQYQWIISKTTVVQPATDNSLPRELGAPKFTRFADIPSLAGLKTLIDILAIVIDQNEPKTINNEFGQSIVQEFFVINDEQIPMMLSLWNEVLASEGQVILTATDKMPIIAATRLGVSDYSGISLSARGSANIILNPSYPETQSLRNWRSRNFTYLAKVVEEKKYLQRSTRPLITSQENYSTLANALTKEDTKFRVKVTARIADYGQRFWYMSCDNCYKRTAADYLWNFTCNVCHAKTVAMPRTKFAMIFFDGTTELEAVLFGDIAQTILSLTPMELMKKDEQNEKVDCDAVNARLHGKQFNADIRRKKIQTQYGEEYQYTVFDLKQRQPSPMERHTDASLEQIQPSSIEYDTEASSSTYGGSTTIIQTAELSR